MLSLSQNLIFLIIGLVLLAIGTAIFGHPGLLLFVIGAGVILLIAAILYKLWPLTVLAGIAICVWMATQTTWWTSHKPALLVLFGAIGTIMLICIADKLIVNYLEKRPKYRALLRRLDEAAERRRPKWRGQRPLEG